MPETKASVLLDVLLLDTTALTLAPEMPAPNALVEISSLDAAITSIFPALTDAPSIFAVVFALFLKYATFPPRVTPPKVAWSALVEALMEF